jgi:hypothetical protein
MEPIEARTGQTLYSDTVGKNQTITELRKRGAGEVFKNEVNFGQK